MSASVTPLRASARRDEDDATRHAHRAFLDAYYGATHAIYDVTRRYYLFGRDRALDLLARERWRTLVDVGCGTGRNLEKLHRARPGRRYAGIEPSAPMRDRAVERLPFARIIDAFAEDAPYLALAGGPPDRILFSYSLSMVADPDEALAHARVSLSERGKLVVVDFGDLAGVPRPLRRAFVRWLDAFHVRPVPRALFDRHRATLHAGPFGYYRIATMGPAHAPR
ncbi:MAG: class I SAM-dependent methyltransferase [Sandaracinus sp.]